MKRKILTFRNVAIGVVISGTIAGTSYLIYSNNKKPKQKYKFHFNIENKSTLNSEVIEKLDSLMIKKLKYNIDSYLLNKVKIISSIDKNFNGFYSQATDEIILNTRYLDEFHFTSNDDKANYLFQILFHEYNHFLSNHYLNNVLPTDLEYKNDSIFESFDSGRALGNWNKAFVSELKSNLNYNIDSPKYESTPIISGKNYVSLGSVYNSKEIYEIANGKEEPSYTKLKGNEIMAPIDPDARLDLKNHIISSDGLAYSYSMAEIVARKLQVVNQTYEPGGSFGNDGWITTPRKISWSPYLADILNYQRGLNDISNKGQYLQDKPNDDTSKIFDKYVSPQMAISNLEFKNNQELADDLKSVTGNYDKTKIMMAGQLPLKNTPNYINEFKIGYLDNDVFTPINISIWLGIENIIKYKFTNYLNVDEILNKKLVYKDEGGVHPLNFGMEDKKMVSTYKQWDKNNTNYQISKDKDGNVSLIKV